MQTVVPTVITKVFTLGVLALGGEPHPGPHKLLCSRLSDAKQWDVCVMIEAKGLPAAAALPDGTPVYALCSPSVSAGLNLTASNIGCLLPGVVLGNRKK